jgi:predicted transcriptional regulator
MAPTGKFLNYMAVANSLRNTTKRQNFAKIRSSATNEQRDVAKLMGTLTSTFRYKLAKKDN